MNLLINLFKIIFIPLVLTIVIELGVWKVTSNCLKSYKLPFIIASIITINILTNPTINIITSWLNPARELYLLEIGLEILVVIVEALILYLIYKKEFNKFLLLSALMNICSYGIGLILFTPAWL